MQSTLLSRLIESLPLLWNLFTHYTDCLAGAQSRSVPVSSKPLICPNFWSAKCSRVWFCFIAPLLLVPLSFVPVIAYLHLSLFLAQIEYIRERILAHYFYTLWMLTFAPIPLMKLPLPIRAIRIHMDSISSLAPSKTLMESLEHSTAP